MASRAISLPALVSLFPFPARATCCLVERTDHTGVALLQVGSVPHHCDQSTQQNS